MKQVNKKWDVELLIYTNGTQVRYREQSRQHSDEYLAHGAIRDYFGIQAGSFVKRVQVAAVEDEAQAKLLKSTFKTYLNKMGTPLLGRGVEPDAKTSIVDKILPTIKSIKQDSTLNDNQIDELWDEVEQIYAENSNGTDKGLSQTIDSALAKL